MPEVLINAWDTISSIGGSRMAEETLDAYIAADSGDVPLAQLYPAAGRKIAELTGAQAACITGGASAGILMAVAASITRGDKQAFRRLPQGHYLPVAMLCAHRNPYAQAAQLTGVRLLEVDTFSHADVSAVLYFAAEKYAAKGESLRQCARAAHAAGVPVIVDAAAQLPPLHNFNRYLADGADFVLFSGGKAIEGPQSCGFAIGSPVWMQRLERLTLTARGLAALAIVGGIQIIGLLTALDRFVRHGCAERIAWCGQCCGQIAQALAGLYQVEISNITPLGQTYPRLLLRSRYAAADMQAWLAERGILVGMEKDMLCINPWSLRDAEAAELVTVLREVAMRGLH